MASSTLRCGTISPAILLKRESRSVMREEAFVVEQRDVAGDVPAVAEDVGGALGLVQVAEHSIGALHQQQPFGVGRQRREGDGVHDARRHARQRVADGARLVCRSGVSLPALEVGRVDRDHGDISVQP